MTRTSFIVGTVLVLLSFETHAGRGGGPQKTSAEVLQSQQDVQEHGGCDPGYQQMIDKVIQECEESVSQAAKDCDQSCFQQDGDKAGESCSSKQKKVDCSSAQGQAGSGDYKAALKAAAQCHRDQAAVYGSHKKQCSPHKDKILESCKTQKLSFSDEIIKKCSSSIQQARNDVAGLRDQASKRVEDSVFDDEMNENLSNANAREADTNAGQADLGQAAPAISAAAPHCNEDGICPAVGVSRTMSEIKQSDAELNRFGNGTEHWTHDENGRIVKYEPDKFEGAVQKTTLGGEKSLLVATPEGFKDAQRFQTTSVTGGIVSGVKANDGSYSIASMPSSQALTTSGSATAPNFSRPDNYVPSSPASPASSTPTATAPSRAPSVAAASKPATPSSSGSSSSSAPPSSGAPSSAAPASPQQQSAAQPQSAAPASGGASAPASAGPKIAGTSATASVPVTPSLDSRFAVKDLEVPETKKVKPKEAEAAAKGASAETTEGKEEPQRVSLSLTPTAGGADVGSAPTGSWTAAGGGLGGSPSSPSTPTSRRGASISSGSWGGGRSGFGSRIRSFASWASGGRVNLGGDGETAIAREPASTSGVDLAQFLPSSAAVAAPAEAMKAGGLKGSLSGEPLGPPNADLFHQAASRYKALEPTFIENP